MSWLFGIGKGQENPPLPPQFSGLGQPPPGDGGGGAGGSGKDDQGRDGKTRSDAYSFDSAALERAANAAKDLEKSRKHMLLT